MPTQTNLLDLEYTLDDKYARQSGRIYLAGVQALVPTAFCRAQGRF